MKIKLNSPEVVKRAIGRLLKIINNEELNLRFKIKNPPVGGQVVKL